MQEVVSSADVEEAKPAPDIFEVAIRRAGLDSSRVVAVGDTVWDVEAARRCGLGCVGVLTGGTCEHRLIEVGALAVYEDCADLLARLDESPIGAILSGLPPG